MNSERINSLLRSRDILQARLRDINTELQSLGHEEEQKLSPVSNIILSVLDSIMTMEDIIEAVHSVKTYHEQYIRSSMCELVNDGLVHKIGTRGRGVKYCLHSKWVILNGNTEQNS